MLWHKSPNQWENSREWSFNWCVTWNNLLSENTIPHQENVWKRCGIFVVLTCSCRAAARCVGSAGGSWPGRWGTHRWLPPYQQSLHWSVWLAGYWGSTKKKREPQERCGTVSIRKKTCWRSRPKCKYKQRVIQSVCVYSVCEALAGYRVTVSENMPVQK